MRYTKKQLLSLPLRHWATPSTYCAIAILANGKKHESEWGLMSVIGFRNLGTVERRDIQPVEVATHSTDDIEWITENFIAGEFRYGEMRMDCILPAKAMHYWSNKYDFLVGEALSSLRIEMVERVKLL